MNAMSKLLNFSFNKLSRQKRSCRNCIYYRSGHFGHSVIFRKCEVYGISISENEVDRKSCWRFGRRKEGISIERQIHEHWINRLKRNWFYIIIATSTIITLIITTLKLFNVI